MPAPFTVETAGNGFDLITADKLGNLSAAGFLKTGKFLELVAQASAPVQVPGALILYSPDGSTLSTVTPAGNVTSIAFGPQPINAQAFGAKGDGVTDDTVALQNGLNAAGNAGTAFYLPSAPGGCYRTTGLSVPGGLTAILGQTALFRSDGPTVTSLTGSVLAPLNASGISALLKIGVSGAGSVVTTNPHGLVVQGIGFLGTTAAGTVSSGMSGAIVTDTSDVNFMLCRDLYIDSVLSGGPTGGAGTGAFVQFLSSASGNGFSENGVVAFGRSYGASKFLIADGLASGNGGSTDGTVFRCQMNSHHRGIQLGPTNAGTGGWDITDCHFSSTSGLNHINYGSAGSPWTTRVDSCYFDVSTGSHIICNGRGLQVLNSYFRYGANTIAISFGSGLNTQGRDPAAIIVGCEADLNGSTTATCFASFGGFSAANFGLHGGGAYRSNVCHNHGAAMPGSWISPFIGSDSGAITTVGTATLDLSTPAVLSA